jgi:bifunctional DNase/RNase
MQKVKLNIIGFYQPMPSDKSCFIILQEEKGTRKIVVQTGIYESDAVFLALENIRPQIPFIHDLFYNLAKVSRVTIKEVLFDKLVQQKFSTIIAFEFSGHLLEIPARPCDSIALAIRFKAPLLIDEELLAAAALIISSTKDLEDLTKKKEVPKIEDLEKLSYEELKSLLQQSLEGENYELAGKIRDELLKRNLPGMQS